MSKILYEYFRVECRGKDIDEVVSWYAREGWKWDNSCVFVTDWYEEQSSEHTLYFYREKLKEHCNYPISNAGETTQYRSWYIMDEVKNE